MAGPSVNLLEILRPDNVSVTVAGHRFVLQATSASQWLGAIALDPEDLAGVVPGLIADDDLEAMERIAATHPDFHERWIQAARTALGRAGGRDWWWTRNLCRQALGTWMYTNGMLMRQGIRISTTTLPDWLDACYTLWWQNASEEDRIKLDLNLGMPPAGIAVRQSRTATREMASAFAAD